MKKYLEILRNCKLFESIEDENLLVMLSCLGAEVMSYTKNQYIFTVKRHLTWVFCCPGRHRSFV